MALISVHHGSLFLLPNTASDARVLYTEKNSATTLSNYSPCSASKLTYSAGIVILERYHRVISVKISVEMSIF